MSYNLASSKAIFYSKARMPLLLLCKEIDRLKPHHSWYLATRDSLKRYKQQFNPVSVSSMKFICFSGALNGSCVVRAVNTD